MDEDGKKQRKQLSNSMEHMRSVVTVAAEEDAYGVPASFQPLRKPKTDSASNPQKRTDPFQFGSRYLEEGDDIFAYNAWDHVEVDDDYKKFAEEQYEKQRESPVEDTDKKRFLDHPERPWNKFYSHNNANFFKDRKWLQQEFPILTTVTQSDSPPTVLLEVGAGAGNTAFPILTRNKNPGLKIHACDFSKKAVELIKSSEFYSDSNNIGSIQASVWDVASPINPETQAPTLPEGLQPESVDVVILIFIFSALAPSQWDQAIQNIWHVLRPGGIVLFRDYGRGDLAQVRFKKGRYLDENFYVRGDGTRVYFFDEDELRALWTGSGCREQLESSAKGLKFELLNFGIDRRMLVNRQRRLKMYRCWLQARFRKPSIAEAEPRNGHGNEDEQRAIDLLSQSTPETISVLEPQVDKLEISTKNSE